MTKLRGYTYKNQIKLQISQDKQATPLQLSPNDVSLYTRRQLQYKNVYIDSIYRYHNLISVPLFCKRINYLCEWMLRWSHFCMYVCIVLYGGGPRVPPPALTLFVIYWPPDGVHWGESDTWICKSFKRRECACVKASARFSDISYCRSGKLHALCNIHYVAYIMNAWAHFSWEDLFLSFF